jgi:hypothetical protein
MGKSKLERFEKLLDRQIETSKKQVNFVDSQKKILATKMTKYQNPKWVERLEHQNLQLEERIKLQREKVNLKRQQEINLFDHIIDKHDTKNIKFKEQIRNLSEQRYYEAEDDLLDNINYETDLFLQLRRPKRKYGQFQRSLNKNVSKLCKF